MGPFRDSHAPSWLSGSWSYASPEPPLEGPAHDNLCVTKNKYILGIKFNRKK